MSSHERRITKQPTSAVELVKLVEEQDVNIAELRAYRARVMAQFQDNLQLIGEGDWNAVQPLERLEYLDLPRNQYEVAVTRNGELVSREPAKHPYLATRREVPGIVKLTAGDLEANAEWDVLPVLTTDAKRPRADVWRALIETVDYQLLMRRIYTARHMLSQRIWSDLRKDNAGWNLETKLEELNTRVSRPLRALDVMRFLERPSQVSERVAFTMAGRVGDHLDPAVRAFKARSGVDQHEKVDLILRFLDEINEPYLVGLDLTTDKDSVHIWEKVQRQGRIGRHSVRGTLRDPMTLQEHLPAIRDVALLPPEIDWVKLLATWREERGSTSVTPEHVLPIDSRVNMAVSLFNHFVLVDGYPRYTADQLQAAYADTYGQWDKTRKE